MYKLPKDIKTSVVYKGMRVVLGAKHVNYFLRTLYKNEGYVLVRCLNLTSGFLEGDNKAYAELVFTRNDKEFLVCVSWYTVGMDGLLTSIYKIRDMEITEYEAV